jgi:hypothetical protein
MIGTTLGYQEFATGSKPAGVPNQMDSGSAARGAVGAVDVTYHFNPYQRLDPWMRVGTGYRFLWEVHNAPGRTYGYHGFDWARLAVGADMRVSEDVAIAPVLGADLNTFVWKVGAPQAPITDLGTSVFVYAGLQGRFDVGVSNAKYDAAVSETRLTQAELSSTSKALVQSNDQLDRERDKAAHLDKMVGTYVNAAAIAELRAQAYRDIGNRLRGQIDAGDLKVVVRDNRMILQLSDDILFASGHADLTPSGTTTLAAVADALKPVQGRHFQVGGAHRQRADPRLAFRVELGAVERPRRDRRALPRRQRCLAGGALCGRLRRRRPGRRKRHGRGPAAQPPDRDHRAAQPRGRRPRVTPLVRTACGGAQAARGSPCAACGASDEGLNGEGAPSPLGRGPGRATSRAQARRIRPPLFSRETFPLLTVRARRSR